MTRSILVVSNVFPPEVVGGAELVAHRQAKAMAQRGFNVSVFTGALGDQALQLAVGAPTLEDGLRVWRLSLRAVGMERSHKRPEIEAQFDAVLREARPDVVHFHNLPQLGAGLIPRARAAGARCLVTLHDSWGFCLRQTQLRDGGVLCNDATECDLCLASVPDARGALLPVRLRRDYVRWCLEQADRLLFPSESLRHSYAAAGLSDARFTQLSNGIDLGSFPGRQRNPEGCVRFLCIGTLNEHKGSRVLWDALEILLRNAALDGRWSMTLAGDGPFRAELRARFDAGRLHAPVDYAGFISRAKIRRTYDRADAVVLASICPENQPVVLLEAAASGAAQIGTRIGGIPELIEDGISGLIVPPGDAPALAAAMRRLILDPGLLRSFSASNLARRGAFDEAASLARLAELLADPSPSAAAPQRPAVICWGAMAGIDGDGPISRRLRRLDDRLRLLWHEWVEPDLPADLLCVFGQQMPFGAIARAALARRPMLLPRRMAEALPNRLHPLVHSYDTEGDALERVEAIAWSGMAADAPR